jgi:hypothetical protein
VIAALALCVSLTVSEAGAKPRTCTPVTVRVYGNDFSYRVKVLKGQVSCKVARSTLKHFIAKSSNPRGWACFRGHSADKWAAKCSSTGKALKTIQASGPIAD